MNTYIAFFDVLGFKEFIKNNDLEEVKRRFNHVLRESQTAVSGGNTIQLSYGLVPDLSKQKVNCLHISDSIIFWTNTARLEDFIEIANVCYTFYWRSLQTTFPLRGCLTFGEIDFQPQKFDPSQQGEFFNSSLLGKGIVDAYLKSDSLEYAGCIIDESALKDLPEKTIYDLLEEQKICLYKVPYKDNCSKYEHVFRPNRGKHDDVSFRNAAINIKSLFCYTSKVTEDELPQSVKNKLNNTIDFINYFRETESTKKEQ